MKRTIKIITKNRTEAEPEEVKNDFEKTGVSSFKLNLNITLTQKDLETDLIKRTDGKFIKASHFEESNN
ncbi:hypothetical protein [Pedobacter sp. Leaf170]|uniref:hypothetical protein n=1 Tax=Pedobacter sp. Leaf170 TaxID=2876558 RepID=UPI001E363CD4|nr:hypothetical protein [Pedobacter sp. Leaf170]